MDSINAIIDFFADLFATDVMEVTFEQLPQAAFQVVSQAGAAAVSDGNDLRLVFEGRGGRFVLTDGMKRVTVERVSGSAITVLIEEPGYRDLTTYGAAPAKPAVFLDPHGRYATVTRLSRSRFRALRAPVAA